MKRPTLLLFATLALGLAANAQELPVGTISQNVDFTLFESGGPANRSLSQFEGQVLVLYYYTPW